MTKRKLKKESILDQFFSMFLFPVLAVYTGVFTAVVAIYSALALCNFLF